MDYVLETLLAQVTEMWIAHVTKRGLMLRVLMIPGQWQLLCDFTIGVHVVRTPTSVHRQGRLSSSDDISSLEIEYGPEGPEKRGHICSGSAPASDGSKYDRNEL